MGVTQSKEGYDQHIPSVPRWFTNVVGLLLESCKTVDSTKDTPEKLCQRYNVLSWNKTNNNGYLPLFVAQVGAVVDSAQKKITILSFGKYTFTNENDQQTIIDRVAYDIRHFVVDIIQKGGYVIITGFDDGAYIASQIFAVLSNTAGDDLPKFLTHKQAQEQLWCFTFQRPLMPTQNSMPKDDNIFDFVFPSGNTKLREKFSKRGTTLVLEQMNVTEWSSDNQHQCDPAKRQLYEYVDYFKCHQCYKCTLVTPPRLEDIDYQLDEYSSQVIKMDNMKLLQVNLVLRGRNAIICMGVKSSAMRETAVKTNIVEDASVFEFYIEEQKDDKMKITIETPYSTKEYEIELSKPVSVNIGEKRLFDLSILTLYKYAFNVVYETNKARKILGRPDSTKESKIQQVKSHLRESEQIYGTNPVVENDVLNEHWQTFINADDTEQPELKTMFADALNECEQSIDTPPNFTKTLELAEEYNLNSIHSLRALFPFLISSFRSVYKEPQVDMSLYQKIALGLGGTLALIGVTVAVAGSVVFTLGASLAGIGLFVGAGGVGVLAVVPKFLKKKERQYTVWLQLLLQSMDDTASPSEPIMSIYETEKIICHRFKMIKNIKPNVESIVQNWGKVFPKGILNCITASNRAQVAKILLAVRVHYVLRNTLIKTFSFMILGEGNCGKTTLFGKLTNADVHGSLNIRTDDTLTYRTDQYYIVDAPHFDSSSVEDQLTISSKSDLLNAAVLVLDARELKTKRKVKIINFLHDLKVPFIVCLNRADDYFYVKNEPQTRQSMEEKLKEFATQFTPPLEPSVNLFFTQFEVFPMLLNEGMEKELEKIKENMKRCGVKDDDFVKEWMQATFEFANPIVASTPTLDIDGFDFESPVEIEYLEDHIQ
jgi:GTP-binding protein EngB required for normal cell division